MASLCLVVQVLDGRLGKTELVPQAEALRRRALGWWMVGPDPEVFEVNEIERERLSTISFWQRMVQEGR